MTEDSKAIGIGLALAGTLLYVASDALTKGFLATTPVLDIALVRFAVGLPLVVFVGGATLRSLHAIGFTIVNTVNSLAGVYALTAGSLTGFAIASQMRPLFVSGLGILFFGAYFSRKILALLLAAFLLSVAVFAGEPDIGHTANLLFVLTVALQSAAFAAFGSHHTNRHVLGFTGLYNLVGFLTCLALKLAFWREPAFTAETLGVNLVNGLVALAASLCVIMGYRTRHKVQASATNYLRLPISLILATFLFQEAMTLTTVLASLAILAIVFEIGRSKVDSGTALPSWIRWPKSPNPKGAAGPGASE